MKARDKKCLCLDVRNLLGSHNLKIPERTNAPRGLTDKAQASRLGFFRRIASSRNGLRSRPTRLPLSARVAQTSTDGCPWPLSPDLAPKSLVSLPITQARVFVVGLPIAIRKGTFRLGRETNTKKDATSTLFGVAQSLGSRKRSCIRGNAVALCGRRNNRDRLSRVPSFSNISGQYSPTQDCRRSIFMSQ